MRSTLLLLAIVLSSFLKLEAQQLVESTEMELYQSALQMYNSRAYTSAYSKFSELKKNIDNKHSLLAVNVIYYHSRSAMQLFHKDAEVLMEEFLKNYPNSTLYYEACRNLADYYFQKRAYNTAVGFYQKINAAELRKKHRASYTYNFAYSLFSIKEYQEAAALFHDLLSSENKFNTKSKYYFAYIAYLNSNFATAKMYFDQLLKEGEYSEDVPLFIAQILHKQEQYDELIEFGIKYNDSISDASVEMYKLIAEAYYHIKDYEQCIHFFEKYPQKDQLDNQGFYLFGQAYYRTGEFALASTTFNKIIGAEDSLAQNAYYYLADCYIELSDKRSAQNAFESASYYKFNDRITEHATFNFAKLCYELGYPYADPTMILQDFINDFPNSEFIDETYTYLVNAFLTHKDYDRAIKSMEINGLENLRLQQAYQEVSYYRAVQLFNDGKYSNALDHFEKALLYAHNKDYQAFAYYWSAEAFYILGEFQKAINTYKQFQNAPAASTLNEFESVYYHLGYAHFKLWEFEKALKSFETFTGNANESDYRLHDSYVRMGDAAYMIKQYDLAISNYQNAVDLSGVDADYSAYQIALAYQQMNQHQMVVDYLSNFDATFNNSVYMDDALYSMGESFMKLNKSDETLEIFNNLSIKYPNSPYVSSAKMKVGLVLYNQGEYHKSITQFKEIVAQYPSTTIAREAINNARSAYVDLGEVQAYADWVETLSFINLSTASLDSTSFESAQLQYLKADYIKSYQGFKAYLNNHKNAIFGLEAQHYFAQSAKEIDSLDEALVAYERICEYHQNPYTSNAIKQAALLYQELNLYDKALEKFSILDASAENVEEQLFAKNGRMHCYLKLNEYDNAIEQAQIILNSGRVDQSLIIELNTFIARAAFLNFDRELSAEKYQHIEAQCQGELKAEAMYHLAYFEFFNGNYQASKQLIFEQTRLLPLYKKWLGKAFILLAKNYIEEEDVFQATHTLEQLILNIDEEELLKEAKSLLAELSSRENKPQKLSLNLDTHQRIDTLNNSNE